MENDRYQHYFICYYQTLLSSHLCLIIMVPFTHSLLLKSYDECGELKSFCVLIRILCVQKICMKSSFAGMECHVFNLVQFMIINKKLDQKLVLRQMSLICQTHYAFIIQTIRIVLPYAYVLDYMPKRLIYSKIQRQW